MNFFLRAARMLACWIPLLAAVSWGAQWEDDMLVAEVWLGGSPVSAGTEILYRNGSVYLPADFFASVLGVSLETDGAGVTSGWIYDEDNRAELNPSARTACVGDKTYALSEADAVYQDGAWWYGTDFIGRIFKLSFTFDYSRLLLEVRSLDVPLPAESESEKERRRRIFDAARANDSQENAPVVRNESFLQTPFVDLSARYHVSKDKNGTRDNFWGYSANAFAVTGGFDTEAYVYDMDNDSPATIALKTSRYQADGKMLGLFK